MPVPAKRWAPRGTALRGLPVGSKGCRHMPARPATAGDLCLARRGKSSRSDGRAHRRARADMRKATSVGPQSGRSYRRLGPRRSGRRLSRNRGTRSCGATGGCRARRLGLASAQGHRRPDAHLPVDDAGSFAPTSPRLKSLGAPTNLPRPATPLVGRGDVLIELRTTVLQPETRVLTLWPGRRRQDSARTGVGTVPGHRISRRRLLRAACLGKQRRRHVESDRRQGERHHANYCRGSGSSAVRRTKGTAGAGQPRTTRGGRHRRRGLARGFSRSRHPHDLTQAAPPTRRA